MDLAPSILTSDNNSSSQNWEISKVRMIRMELISYFSLWDLFFLGKHKHYITMDSWTVKWKKTLIRPFGAPREMSSGWCGWHLSFWLCRWPAQWVYISHGIMGTFLWPKKYVSFPYPQTKSSILPPAPPPKSISTSSCDPPPSPPLLHSRHLITFQALGL